MCASLSICQRRTFAFGGPSVCLECVHLQIAEIRLLTAGGGGNSSSSGSGSLSIRFCLRILAQLTAWQQLELRLATWTPTVDGRTTSRRSLGSLEHFVRRLGVDNLCPGIFAYTRNRKRTYFYFYFCPVAAAAAAVAATVVAAALCGCIT